MLIPSSPLTHVLRVGCWCCMVGAVHMVSMCERWRWGVAARCSWGVHVVRSSMHGGQRKPDRTLPPRATSPTYVPLYRDAIFSSPLRGYANQSVSRLSW